MAHFAQHGADLNEDCEIRRWQEPSQREEEHRLVYKRGGQVLYVDATFEDQTAADDLEEWYGKAHSIPSPVTLVSTEDDLASEFSVLVKKWRAETAGHSLLLKKVMHPAYQQIIGMGEKAMPLILREMQRYPSHWFWALDAITRSKVNPAKDAKDLEDAAKAWLDWGRSKGHL